VGKVKCFDCCAPEGFSEREGKKTGFKDVRSWFGLGELVEERPCATCKQTGSLRCPRCKGTRKLLFRSAAWR